MNWHYTLIFTPRSLIKDSNVESTKEFEDEKS